MVGLVAFAHPTHSPLSSDKLPTTKCVIFQRKGVDYSNPGELNSVVVIKPLVGLWQAILPALEVRRMERPAETRIGLSFPQFKEGLQC